MTRPTAVTRLHMIGIRRKSCIVGLHPEATFPCIMPGYPYSLLQ
jgi:hypothetical protein